MPWEVVTRTAGGQMFGPFVVSKFGLSPQCVGFQPVLQTSVYLTGEVSVFHVAFVLVLSGKTMYASPCFGSVEQRTCRFLSCSRLFISLFFI